MTLTEVIEGLQVVREYCRVRPFAVDAAITHLDPYTQPITPERLEAAGFVMDRDGYWKLNADSQPYGQMLYYKPGRRAGEMYVVKNWENVNYPGVRSMGHVLSLIEMLEGGDHA